MAEGSVAATWTQLMADVRVEGNAATLEIPAPWLQGRTAFGGLQAALALRAMRTLVPATPLRTLQATFLAPVPAGRALASAKLLRAGKNASHVEARILDGDNTAALLVGVFGSARESSVNVTPKPPATKPNAQPIPFRYLPNVVPAFTQFFDARWIAGLPPFTGDTATEHVLELGLREGGLASEAVVLALADFIPPLALSHLKAPANGATLTWMIEMLAGNLDGIPATGWRVDASLVAARDGYTSQSVMLSAPGGVPVALSRQSMVVFG
jgi:acyl-CoA thioesterase